MRSILRFFSFCSLMFVLLSNALRQKRFLKTALQEELDWAEANNDGTVKPSDLKKIKYYYGMAVTSVLGESYAAFLGRSLSEKERYKLTYLGAYTGLFDDFFDDFDRSPEYVYELMTKPQEQKPANTHEALFLRLYLNVLNDEDADHILRSGLPVYEAQVKSLKQESVDISLEEIDVITREKGGYSLLYYRCPIQPEPSQRESEFLFAAGAFLQLLNDIFDVYKDQHAGIQTRPTRSTSVDDLRSYFLSEMRAVQGAYDRLDIPSKRSRRFFNLIVLTMARGLVCLEHYQKAEATSQGVFRPDQYERKQLICDMETLSNNLKQFGYFIRYRRISKTA